MLPILAAFILAIVSSHEANYIDASGASCISFDTHIGEEIDLCHGRFDR